MQNKSVSIRFKQQAYRLLKNYAFKPAYVFAEYIDNSIQSFNDNKNELSRLNRNVLKITITKFEDKIVILDNAGGISDKKMESAFEPGSMPENNKGLNEFGIGLKNASVWMSDYYEVETSSINESYSKKIAFDYHKVLTDEIEDLDIVYKKTEANNSFTKITLTKLRSDIAKFNFDQIRKELGSIYRGMLNSGELEISFLGEELFYTQPEFLEEPYFPDYIKYKNGQGSLPKKIKWKYDFDIKYKDKRIHGFVGILSKMQKNENGISYCRRGRVIQGSGDEKMFPTSICSSDPSSHQRKRIFGEFNFEGFEVSFDKGKLLAEEEAESLIDLVAEQLKMFKPQNSSNTYDFLKQARELRLGEDIKEKDVIEKLQKKHKATEKLKEIDDNENIEKEKYKRILEKSANSKSIPNKPIEIKKEESIEKLIPGNNNEKYLMVYTIKNEPNSEILYDMQVSDVKDRGQKDYLNKGITRIIKGYINIACPFLFKNDQLIKGKSGEAFYEFIEYLMISEAISKIKGVEKSHYLRDTLNELINT